jgi:hypothetical protein
MKLISLLIDFCEVLHCCVVVVVAVVEVVIAGGLWLLE